MGKAKFDRINVTGKGGIIITNSLGSSTSYALSNCKFTFISAS